MALTERYVTTAGDATDAQATYDAAVDVAHACSLTVALKYAVAGDRVNICAGTYSRSAGDTVTNAGTVGSPIILRGVDATGNPLTVTRTNGNGPLVTTGWPLITWSSGSLTTAKTHIQWRNLYLQSATFTVLCQGVDNQFIGCSIKSTGNASTARCIFSSASPICVDCDFTLTGATSDYALNPAGAVIGCHFFNSSSTTNGNCNSGGPYVGNVFGSTIGVHIDNFVANVVSSNTFYSASVADIRTANSSQTVPYIIVNNIFTDSARAMLNLFNGTASHPLLWSNNRTRDNANADLGFGDWPIYNAVTTDTGGPETDYVDAAGGDFRLIAASPAVGAGLPAYRDIGALQRQASSNVIVIED